MTAKRWWDVAFAGAIAVMAGVTLVGWAASEAHRLAALATLAVIAICYVAFGRRGLDERRASVAFRIVLIVGCGVATMFSPSVASFQFFTFPFLWALSSSLVACIVMSGLLATSVGFGFAIGQGGTPDAILQAVAIESLSFIFAIAFGLWITRIAENGERHRVLLEELTAAQGELAALHRDAGSTTERERLAREIHDTIAQSLTSTVMLAQRVRRELDAVAADTTAVEDTVEMIESTAREALTDARSLVASMSPVRSVASGDEQSSLADAVARLAARFERETGIQVDSGVEAAALDRELEVVLLRCAQEGLANVRKHSQASAASVTIWRDDRGVTLEVRDNGVGLGTYSPETESGFGRTGMRDRVYLVGGELRVSSGADGGTVLRIRIPSGAPLGERPMAEPGPTPPVPGDQRPLAEPVATTHRAHQPAAPDPRSTPPVPGAQRPLGEPVEPTLRAHQPAAPDPRSTPPVPGNTEDRPAEPVIREAAVTTSASAAHKSLHGADDRGAP